MSAAMTMLLLLALIIGFAVAPAEAQFAVIDTSAILQQVLAFKNQLQQYAEQLRQTYQQYQQIVNQVEQIRQATITVEQGVINLRTLNYNDAAGLMSLYNQLSNKLAQAQQIGYASQTAFTQASTIYTQAQGVMSGAALRQLKQRMTGAQREAGLVAVNVEAIQQEQAAMIQKNRDLLLQAAGTTGNLQALQVLAQQQGLSTTQLAAMHEQMATQARLAATKALEDATTQQATTQQLQEGAATIDTSAAPAGHILPLSK
jgi:conjugal transfer/entry exclusion protein